MLVLMKCFLNGDGVLVNSSHIVRAVEMKERNGCVLSMVDNTKIMVAHSMDELRVALNVFLDLTKEKEAEE